MATFDNGRRAGRTEATLEDVRDDIAELRKIMLRVTWRVAANSAIVTILSAAIGFLYIALIRNWL